MYSSLEQVNFLVICSNMDMSTFYIQDPENETQPHFSVKVKVSTQSIKIADSHSDVSMSMYTVVSIKLVPIEDVINDHPRENHNNIKTVHEQIRDSDLLRTLRAKELLLNAAIEVLRLEWSTFRPEMTIGVW